MLALDSHLYSTTLLFPTDSHVPSVFNLTLVLLPYYCTIISTFGFKAAFERKLFKFQPLGLAWQQRSTSVCERFGITGQLWLQ